MQNGPNANGRYYPTSVLDKIARQKPQKVEFVHMSRAATDEWIHYEYEASQLSIEERLDLFATAWDWKIKAHTDRASIAHDQTRIAVSPRGLKGIRQGRRLYYDLEDFKKLYDYVTRNRQCGTGLMRKGALCGKDV